MNTHLVFKKKLNSILATIFAFLYNLLLLLGYMPLLIGILAQIIIAILLIAASLKCKICNCCKNDKDILIEEGEILLDNYDSQYEILKNLKQEDDEKCNSILDKFKSLEGKKESILIIREDSKDPNDEEKNLKDQKKI